MSTCVGSVQGRGQRSYNLPIDLNPAYGFDQIGVQQDGNRTVQAHESQSVVGITSKENAIL